MSHIPVQLDPVPNGSLSFTSDDVAMSLAYDCSKYNDEKDTLPVGLFVTRQQVHAAWNKANLIPSTVSEIRDCSSSCWMLKLI